MHGAMAWTRTYTDPEPSRVNKWLGQSGVCSRREAEALIAQGLVSIDGEVVTDAGRKIAAGQTLTLADGATTGLGAAFSVVLNKPRGIVSAQPEAGQTPAVRLLTKDRLWGSAPAIPGKDSSLAPLGRLDMDSRGLLLLSEDGVLAKALIGPQSGMEKEYLVRVNGEITADKIGLLTHGLELDDRKLKPAKVTQVDDRQLRIILTEGRNRQIRRMCSLVRLAVTDLYRIRVGPLHLDNLPEGRWRPLSPEERVALIGAPH
jgi:23S rRNA pseudouridine2604 synthase